MVAGEGMHAPAASEREFPPIAPLAVVSMALIIAGGIYLAAYLPKTPSLWFPTVTLAAAVLTLGASMALLRAQQNFAWDRFALVARWALLAYAVIAGMLEYIFVVDGVRGGTLLVLTLSLLIYAVDIPLILAFSVARYAEPGEPI